jgi:hypothetical protein
MPGYLGGRPRWRATTQFPVQRSAQIERPFPGPVLREGHARRCLPGQPSRAGLRVSDNCAGRLGRDHTGASGADETGTSAIGRCLASLLTRKSAAVKPRAELEPAKNGCWCLCLVPSARTDPCEAPKPQPEQLPRLGLWFARPRKRGDRRPPRVPNDNSTNSQRAGDSVNRRPQQGAARPRAALSLGRC